MDELSGQVALVTGGSSGLGKEISHYLAAAGARVGVMARTQDHVSETVAEITAVGGHALAAIGDVSERAAVEAAVAKVESELGPINLLVNNAGVSGPVGPFWEADPDDWWAAVEVNLRGTALCLARDGGAQERADRERGE